MSGGGSPQVNPRGMPGWNGGGGGWRPQNYMPMSSGGQQSVNPMGGGMTDRGIDKPGGFPPQGAGGPTGPNGEPLTPTNGPLTPVQGGGGWNDPTKPNGPLTPAPPNGAPPGFQMPPVNMGNFNPATYGNFNNIFRGNTGMWGGGYGGGGGGLGK